MNRKQLRSHIYGIVWNTGRCVTDDCLHLFVENFIFVKNLFSTTWKQFPELIAVFQNVKVKAENRMVVAVVLVYVSIVITYNLTGLVTMCVCVNFLKEKSFLIFK